MDADVNKPQNDFEHDFTFRHVPYHNCPTTRYVLTSYNVEYFNWIINYYRQTQPDLLYTNAKLTRNYMFRPKSATIRIYTKI